MACLVPRPLSVFHLDQSVSGHAVRAKKRGLDRNQKLRQMSQFFLVLNFDVELFAPAMAEKSEEVVSSNSFSTQMLLRVYKTS